MEPSAGCKAVMALLRSADDCAFDADLAAACIIWCARERLAVPQRARGTAATAANAAQRRPEAVELVTCPKMRARSSSTRPLSGSDSGCTAADWALRSALPCSKSEGQSALSEPGPLAAPAAWTQVAESAACAFATARCSPAKQSAWCAARSADDDAAVVLRAEACRREPGPETAAARSVACTAVASSTSADRSLASASMLAQSPLRHSKRCLHRVRRAIVASQCTLPGADTAAVSSRRLRGTLLEPGAHEAVNVGASTSSCALEAIAALRNVRMALAREASFTPATPPSCTHTHSSLSSADHPSTTGYCAVRADLDTDVLPNGSVYALHHRKAPRSQATAALRRQPGRRAGPLACARTACAPQGVPQHAARPP
jgi:hypothetical protein